jgi:hypothetical protein
MLNRFDAASGLLNPDEFPEPEALLLSTDRTFLVVVDMQNAFFDTKNFFV